MIAPKIVSHVQPSGRDYSHRTSPDIIEAVPQTAPWRGEVADDIAPEPDYCIAGYDFEIVAGAPVCEECQCVCDSASNGPCRCGCPECGCDDLHVRYPEDGRLTLSAAFFLFALILCAGMVAALTLAGMPPAGDISQSCLDGFRTEIGAVTAYDVRDCRDGIADGH